MQVRRECRSPISTHIGGKAVRSWCFVGTLAKAKVFCFGKRGQFNQINSRHQGMSMDVGRVAGEAPMAVVKGGTCSACLKLLKVMKQLITKVKPLDRSANSVLREDCFDASPQCRKAFNCVCVGCLLGQSGVVPLIFFSDGISHSDRQLSQGRHCGRNGMITKRNPAVQR